MQLRAIPALALALAVMILAANVACAGGGISQKTFTINVYNHSATPIRLKSVAWQENGDGYSKNDGYRLNNRITTGKYAQVVIKYNEGGEVTWGSICAYPELGGRDYGLYMEIHKSGDTQFRITDLDIKTWKRGENAQIRY